MARSPFSLLLLVLALAVCYASGPRDAPNGAGDVRDRIIGYYDAWAGSATPPCDMMTPEQIPSDGLTHVNFAFAYLDPDTGVIIPMNNNQEDDSLFFRVADAKKRNPNVEVWISIGGWAFNSDGKYQSVFSEIAGSALQTWVLALRLTTFCNLYGFDGVDIDWEFPGAAERGGSEEDKHNFVRMLSGIRRYFNSHVRPLGLSITVPANARYLTEFDLPRLSMNIDWFNLMSYDLHGAQDNNAYIRPHTNLTEVDAALDHFWRNHIDPSLINLGLSFSGRTFKLETPLCTHAGCKSLGPGKPGWCTQENGILSYREVQELRRTRETYANTYDMESGATYFAYVEQKGAYWVSSEDRRSIQAKINFANERGLGGLFLWTIDQDNDGLDALSSITGKAPRMPPRVSESKGRFDIHSCYFTSCGGECDVGETTMVQTNLDHDKQGCSGGKNNRRTFCCPALTAPDPRTCKWRGSGPFCRDGHCLLNKEVTMLTDNYGGGAGCYWGGLKSWCCPTTVGQDAVTQCAFNPWGNCDDREKPQELTRVTFKIPSGGGVGGPGVILHRSEPLCCPAKPEFKNCAWHGRDGDCSGNRCPVGQITVASTQGDHGGPGSGSGCSLGRVAVFCCDPPADGSEFLPVSLRNLFPDADSFDPSWVPVFEEVIDDSDSQLPHHDPVKQDPNEESFAWVVIVGDQEDVHSFDKRDGSHLKLFDWAEVVAADNDSPVKKRNKDNWREVDKRWVKEHQPQSWYKRFMKLLEKKDVGLVKRYSFRERLYDEIRYCTDNTAAILTMDAAGDLATTMDFGQTIIGTLNDMRFSQAFAFIRQSEFKVHVQADLTAQARVRMRTKAMRLDRNWLMDFGSSYNIKGILRVNPYFDVQAQIQAEAVASLRGTVGVTVTSPAFHFMFPEGLEDIPTTPLGDWGFSTDSSDFNSQERLNADIGGEITIVVVPILGIIIDIDFSGLPISTNIEMIFRGKLHYQLGGAKGTDCNGFRLSVDAGLFGKLSVRGATIFPNWVNGDFLLFDTYGKVLDGVCIPYHGGFLETQGFNDTGNFTSLFFQLERLQSMAFPAGRDSGPIFPDPNRESIYCTWSGKGNGKCRGRHVFVDELEEPDHYLFTRNLLEKRAGDKSFCTTRGLLGYSGAYPQDVILPKHEGTTPWLRKWPKVPTFAPKNPDFCDFEFGKIATPKPGEVRHILGANVLVVQVEHILETQTFKDFLNDLAKKRSNLKGEINLDLMFSDPRGNAGDASEDLHWCQYWGVWWDKKVASNKKLGYPEIEKANTLLGTVLPGANNPAWSELVLVDYYVNQLKAQMFSPRVKFSDQGELEKWQKDPPDDSEMPDPLDIPKGTLLSEEIKLEKEWKEQEKNRPHHWGDILDFIREIVMVYKYMSQDDIQQRLVRSVCRYAHRLDWLNEEYIQAEIGQIQLKHNAYVTKKYDLRLDVRLSQEWMDWIEDTYFLNAETKARDVITKWAEITWKNNRDPNLFLDINQLPVGHRFGTNQDVIDRAQQTLNEVRSLPKWDIQWIREPTCGGTYQEPPSTDVPLDTWPASYIRPIGSD